MRKFFVVMLGCVALTVCVPLRAAGQIDTILIVDATAQMGAKLGQKRKIDLVKSTLGTLTRRLDQTVSFALWTFGADPAKKCDGARELIALQPSANAARTIDKALAPLQPKAARAPIFGTVQTVLKPFAGTKDKAASIVIITGTGDDCVGDICHAATELHNAYPNVKLTILGLATNEQVTANLTCAAKAMGGTFLPVKSGTDLEKNLRPTLNVTQNAQGALNDKSETPSDANPAPNSAPPTPAADEKATAQQASQQEPNVILSAVLTSGQPPLETGVTWGIYKVTTTPTGQLRTAETPSWSGGGGQAKVKLAEGHYLARATYGFASATGEFTVANGKVEKAIPLEAGTIAAEAFQTKEEQSAQPTFFILYRGKQTLAREEVGRSSENPAVFHVAAGDYTISALAGAAKVESSVRVEAGKVSEAKIAMNLGTLELNTFAVEGSSQPLFAWHRVYPEAAGGSKTDTPVLRAAGASVRVQLPAGSYRLETLYGNAREETRVTVAAGQVTSQKIVLNTGEAKLSLAGKTEKICAVFDAGADHNGNPVGRAAGAAGTDIGFILKAGLYDLECRNKGAPSPAKRAQIKVTAGETQSAKIDE